jgi:DMSO reductase iron-sulfur subunit
MTQGKLELAFVVDVSRCVHCYACEVACKVENNLPEGVKWREVIKIQSEAAESYNQKSVSMACMHCANAPCIKACPVNAITKRPDGIVLINDKTCIGCKYCLWACPFGAPQLDVERKVMTKCTMCVHRVDKGGTPACVETCHTHAIKWGSSEELARQERIRAAKGAQRRMLFISP